MNAYKPMLTAMVLVLSSSISIAGTAKEPSSFSDVVLKFASGVSSPGDRSEIARGLFYFCTQLGANIPRLSPRETDWLEGEIAAGRTDAFASDEYNKYFLTELFDDCKRRTSFIKNTPEGSVHLIMWAEVARRFVHPDIRISGQALSRIRILTDSDVRELKMFNFVGDQIIG